MIEYFQQVYSQILGYFPNFLHPYISIVLALLLIYSIYEVIKSNFIYLIVLIVLLPAAIPILKSVFDSIFSIIKFLLGM